MRLEADLRPADSRTVCRQSTELNFSATHLFCETTSHKLHQLCEIPDGAWWFGIPVGRDAAGSIHATPISTEVLAFRPGGCEFELLTPPDYSILGWW